jgi:hypothetical protein
MTGHDPPYGASRRTSVDHGASAWQTPDISTEDCGDVDDWYGRDRFTPGDSYTDADGLFVLQYLGIVSALVARQLLGDQEYEIDPAFDTEPVMLFRVVEDDAELTTKVHPPSKYYTHTKSDADNGYHFIATSSREI